MNLIELREYGKNMEIPKYKYFKKNELITEILSRFQEFKDYKKEHSDRYIKIKQLGITGKEGTVFLVKDKKDGNEYAMKMFKKGKSEKTLKKEINLQKTFEKFGITPKIHDFNIYFKFFVMERMDYSLLDYLKQNNGQMSEDIQKQIINLFKKLDKIKVFHGDANPLNFMFKGNQLYIIDFGFGNEINSKLIQKHNTNTPNMNFMPLGLVLKIKELFKNDVKYYYLEKYIPKEQRELLGF